jgi:hypothetical protein
MAPRRVGGTTVSLPDNIVRLAAEAARSVRRSGPSSGGADRDERVAVAAR